MAFERLTENQAKIFVFLEVLLIILTLVQLYLLLGLDVFESGLTLFARSAPPVQNVLWFVATMILFVTVYFFISKRDSKVIKIHENFSKVILGTSKEKLLGINQNVLILWITQFVFAIILAFSIFVYLDPEVDIVPWPYNYVAFLGVLVVGLYLFSQTKVFREQNYGSGYLLQKIRPAQRIFPSRRLTTKSGNIRVASKKHYSLLRHKQKKIKTIAEKRSERKSKK
jgi:hypothetical protein